MLCEWLIELNQPLRTDDARSNKVFQHIGRPEAGIWKGKGKRTSDDWVPARTLTTPPAKRQRQTR
jgi:hypothetical protein